MVTKPTVPARRLQAITQGERQPARLEPPRIEIVVAQYHENLQWLAGHESLARVYSKGSDSANGGNASGNVLWQENLDNVGLESHTYLKHIARRYHHLADVTLFTQAGIEKSGGALRRTRIHARRGLGASR